MTWKLCVTSVLLGLAAPVSSSEALRINVSPQMSIQPAQITVRASIEPSDENRVIRIIAESDDYFRSSEIQLDGSRASRTNTVQYRDLPAGNYEITVALFGRDGKQRGLAERDVIVMP